MIYPEKITMFDVADRAFEKIKVHDAHKQNITNWQYWANNIDLATTRQDWKIVADVAVSAAEVLGE